MSTDTTNTSSEDFSGMFSEWRGLMRAAKGILRQGTLVPARDGARVIDKSRCITEMALWTAWKHKGTLSTCSDAVVFNLQAQNFEETALEHMTPIILTKMATHATRYIGWLNAQDTADDLSEMEKKRSAKWSSLKKSVPN